MKIFVIGMTILGVIGAQSASAATRAVAFSGIAAAGAGTELVEPVSAQMMTSVECQLVVVNTGSQNQKIERVDFIGVDGDTTGFRTVALQPSSQCRVDPGANNAACADCIGQNLIPGAMCVLTYNPLMLNPPSGHRSGICSGTLVVSDASAGKPGAVVASGTVSVNQEAKVLGGVLSGAYYASGLDNPGNSSIDLNYGIVPQFTGTAGGARINNMNTSCEAACNEGSKLAGGEFLSEFNCMVECGGHTNSNGRFYPHRLSSSNYQGFWELFDPAGSTKTGVAKPYNPDKGNWFSDQSRHPSENVTSSEFAGGMVYEMEVGPLSSICSANNGFVEGGGVYPNHKADKNLSYGQLNTEERLFCAHRHGNNDLFMRVGSASSFPINGGMPF